jgi:small subunit ribosomal protein S20
LANVPSAEKRNRQRIKRQARNRHHMTTTRTLVKRATAALTGGDLQAARTSVQEAARQLDKAAQKGVIHKTTAARKISRLSRALNQKARPSV